MTVDYCFVVVVIIFCSCEASLVGGTRVHTPASRERLVMVLLGGLESRSSAGNSLFPSRARARACVCCREVQRVPEGSH